MDDVIRRRTGHLPRTLSFSRYTRAMKKVLVLIAFGTFVLSGCAGWFSGFGSIHYSPFFGDYTGTWVSNGLSNNGTATLLIDTDGQVRGTVHNNSTDSDGVLTGGIEDDGEVNATVKYPGEAVISLSGTLISDGSGNLSGNLVQRKDGVNNDISLNLDRG